jgi:hypothetical protein
MILFFENRRGNTRRGRQAPKNNNGKYSGNRLKYTPLRLPAAVGSVK